MIKLLKRYFRSKRAFEEFLDWWANDVEERYRNLIK
jgi:hypothetical protein